VAQFEITIKKDLQDSNNSIQWSNNYNVLADNILDAADYAETITEIEQAVHWHNVLFIEQRIAPAVGGGGYRKNIIVQGNRADPDPDVQLPLFNTVLVKLYPSIGRPSLKYLRLPLVEVEVEGFEITDAHVTFLTDNYVTPLIAIGALCNQQGSLITTYDIQRPVQMRQKGWHRRSRPGQHRGWVNN